MAALWLEGQSFSVSSSAIWPVVRSVDLHKDHLGALLCDLSSGHPSTRAPGRLVDSFGIAVSLPRTCRDPSLGCPVSGFHNQPGQIGACSSAVLHVSGYGLRHCPVDHTSISVMRGVSPHSPGPPSVTSAGLSQISCLSPGPDGISLSIGAVGAVNNNNNKVYLCCACPYINMFALEGFMSRVLISRL